MPPHGANDTSPLHCALFVMTMSGIAQVENMDIALPSTSKQRIDDALDEAPRIARANAEHRIISPPFTRTLFVSILLYSAIAQVMTSLTFS